MPVLVVENLLKIFRSRPLFFRKRAQEFTAVDHISFTLNKGEILGLLGPNGAGKTTIIQMLLGTLTPTAGNISYFGKDFSLHRSDIMKHIAFASAYTRLPGKLTINENLDIYGRLYSLSHAERIKRIKELLTFFGIWDIRNQQARTLSAGQTTRMMLAKAFLTNPNIILLDEPTASLDPDIARDVRQFIVQQQREQHISILFTSHNMDEVAEICDRILVLKQGKIIAHDTPKNLAASIGTARVEFVISEGLEQAITYVLQQKLLYTLEKHAMIIEIDEHAIAQLLTEFARLGILYSQISIEKPTLKDYFLHIAKK